MPQAQQIILLDKVLNLGNLGDIVRVKAGYARNFLIPQQKARRATKANVAAFEAKRAELEKAATAKLSAAKAKAQKMEGLVLKISQKAGVDGRLFGSVTRIDIAQALSNQGFAVEKAQIRLSTGPLKAIGEYPVPVVLHTDISATVTVAIINAPR